MKKTNEKWIASVLSGTFTETPKSESLLDLGKNSVQVIKAKYLEDNLTFDVDQLRKTGKAVIIDKLDTDWEVSSDTKIPFKRPWVDIKPVLNVFVQNLDNEEKSFTIYNPNFGFVRSDELSYDDDNKIIWEDLHENTFDVQKFIDLNQRFCEKDEIFSLPIDMEEITSLTSKYGDEGYACIGDEETGYKRLVCPVRTSKCRNAINKFLSRAGLSSKIPFELVADALNSNGGAMFDLWLINKDTKGLLSEYISENKHVHSFYPLGKCPDVVKEKKKRYTS